MTDALLTGFKKQIMLDCHDGMRDARPIKAGIKLVDIFPNGMLISGDMSGMTVTPGPLGVVMQQRPLDGYKPIVELPELEAVREDSMLLCDTSGNYLNKFSQPARALRELVSKGAERRKIADGGGKP